MTDIDRVEEAKQAIAAVNALTGVSEIDRHFGRIWALRAARTLCRPNQFYRKAAAASVVLRFKLGQHRLPSEVLRLLRRIEERRRKTARAGAHENSA